MINDKAYKSACCNAAIKLEFSELPDFLWNEKPSIITTGWFSCLKCGDYCDIYLSKIDEEKEE